MQAVAAAYQEAHFAIHLIAQGAQQSVVLGRLLPCSSYHHQRVTATNLIKLRQVGRGQEADSVLQHIAAEGHRGADRELEIFLLQQLRQIINSVMSESGVGGIRDIIPMANTTRAETVSWLVSE